MLGPATNRIDAAICYIHPLDSAWDRERIKAETATARAAALEAVKASPDKAAAIGLDMRHPVEVYQAGETRFDLDAPLKLWRSATEQPTVVTARDYLLGEATRFFLRRLKRSDWAEIRRSIAGTMPALQNRASLSADEIYRVARADALMKDAALEEACRLGVKKVDPWDGPAWSGSDADLERLHAMSSGLPFDVGGAAFIASAPLTERELFRCG